MTTKVQMTIPVSPEQEDIIFDHAFYDSELGILPDEKVWVYRKMRKKYPNGRLVESKLSIADYTWILTVEVPNEA